MKIYLASSWRNPHYTNILARLRQTFKDDEVYDFRDTNSAFRWSEVSTAWEFWTPNQYLDALGYPNVREAFDNDFAALNAADVVILLNPCGISAHLEAAYAQGAGKRVIDFYTANNSNGAYHHTFHIELMKAMFQMHVVGWHDLETLVDTLRDFID